ncbi:hydroxypyruvate isomerase [Ketogulonicigenium robustum]|uniref:Hydroxypyruvate isomerase n=2 Tax=Ketogulonicigenium robustum TaxID=92947 RepID=A0A1W6P0M7_9RHOB|nr:hydroxypyruvate isomerase [Ketogulonicigenium robustum]
MDRFAAASAAGFKGVEILFPYEYSAVEVLSRLRQYKMDLVAMNAPPPNYTGRPRGFAAVPGGEMNFRRDFQRALRVANAMGALRIQVMAGAADGDVAHATMVDNLRWACAEVANLPVRLTIEPKSREDVAGYFLNDLGRADAIIAEVGADNLGLQFDTYHVAAIAGSVIDAWKAYGHLVSHVQVASYPERAEPAGEGFDDKAFFDLLDADGYDGWVSGEYIPARSTEMGLDWLRRADASI